MVSAGTGPSAARKILHWAFHFDAWQCSWSAVQLPFWFWWKRQPFLVGQDTSPLCKHKCWNTNVTHFLALSLTLYYRPTENFNSLQILTAYTICPFVNSDPLKKIVLEFLNLENSVFWKGIDLIDLNICFWSQVSESVSRWLTSKLSLWLYKMYDMVWWASPIL